MIDPLREIDYIPPNIFGIYKDYLENIYVLWPHNLQSLYTTKNTLKTLAVVYIPFVYRDKPVVIKQ